MNQKRDDRGLKQPLKRLNDIHDPEGTSILEASDREQKKEPVSKLVNRIIMKALKQEASEIHFEPQADCLKIFFRKDGILIESINPLARLISLSMVKYLKNMAKVDIKTKNSYQEGRFSVIIQGNKINFWLNIVPTRYGDKTILRCWNTDLVKLDLGDIIHHQNTFKLVKAIINYPSGLVLVTGPTNSGKSTTIYSLLEEKHKSGANISTIENRIKYSLAGINQIELIKDKHKNYHQHIKFLLNQDVEVIWVDRLRELTTAKAIIDAASHGKNLFSTLSCNNPAGAIIQLLEMGVNPSALAQVLKGVISQRLLRRVCPSCRIAYKPSSIELNRFGITQQEKLELYYADNSKNNECSDCRGVGYKGQIALMEVLPITKKIRSLMVKNADYETLKQAASQQEITDLLSYALDLVMVGETTLAEVERVLPDILANRELERKVSPPKQENVAERLSQLEQKVAGLILEPQQLQPDSQIDLSVQPKTKQVAKEDLEDLEELEELEDLEDLENLTDSTKWNNLSSENLTESELSEEFSVDEIKISPSPSNTQPRHEDVSDPW